MDPLLSAFERLRARRAADPIVIRARARMTVDDLDGLARIAAAALVSGALRAAAPVGLMAPNGPGFLAGLIALRRCGHPAVLLDPLATPREVGSAGGMGPLPILEVLRAWPRGADDFRVVPSPVDRGSADGLPAGAAVVKITSGSTGGSRGVAVTAEALLADDAALRASMGIGARDCLVAAVSFSHSYGLSSLVLCALVGGVPLAMPAGRGPFAPIAAAQNCGATVLHTIPAWIAAFGSLAETPPLPEALRLVISAGAPLAPRTALEFRRRCGRPVHSFYGATECGGISYDRDGEAGERGTVGEPIDGVRVTLSPVPGVEARTVGRVVVESNAAGIGYVAVAGRREDAESLRDGRFVSQDLARRDGTELRLLGRLDDIINVKGRKVRPEEVEQVIARIDGVEGVVVHAMREDGRDAASVRAVVACPRRGLTSRDILDACRGHLSDFKIPRAILFVSELPRTGSGKIDRARAARLKPERSFVHG